ncbi:unnamed protein product [Nezara viridula]|uniref:Uncharacterized protein n=1 Tax=Nezara viridula TaxID=85310 RepID=A0A9P0H5G0_NEZVI|nr:unnamed protein product [Nezara viridula]
MHQSIHSRILRVLSLLNAVEIRWRMCGIGLLWQWVIDSRRLAWSGAASLTAVGLSWFSLRPRHGSTVDMALSSSDCL